MVFLFSGNPGKFWCGWREGMKQTKTDFKTVCERLLPLVFHVAGNFSCAKRCCMTELIDQCLNVVDIFT